METAGVATVLDKALKRQVSVDGVDYTVSLDPEGLRLTAKGRRRAEVELRWRELLSGEAAMAVALNASLSGGPAARPPKAGPSAADATPTAPKKRGTRTHR